MTAQQIIALRKRLGMSGDAFAAAVGLVGKHRGLTVYKWESGDKTPSNQTIMLMKLLKQSALKTQ